MHSISRENIEMNKVRDLTRCIAYVVIILPLLVSAQTLRWSFVSDGPAHQDDEVYKVLYAPDGYVYTVGYQTSTSTGKDVTVMKFSTSGVHQWSYRSYETGDDIGYDIVYGDGNLYVAGYATGGNLKEFLMLSVNTSGGERWFWMSDGPAHQDDEAYSIAYNAGYVYAVGYQTSTSSGKNTTVMALSSSGVHQWSYRTYWVGEDVGNDVAYGDDNNLYVGGYSTGNGKEYSLLSINPTTGIEEVEVASPRASILCATIIRGPLRLPEGKKCIIFDITGRVVEPTKITRGIYFIEIDGALTQKVIKVR